MTESEHNSPERAGFEAFVALLLAPVVAHGAWRPLEHIFGVADTASAVTWGSLAVAAAVWSAGRVGRRGAWRLLLGGLGGGLAAAAASAALSLGVAGLLSLMLVAAVISVVVAWVSARLPASLDGLAARNKGLTALYLLFVLISVFSTARVSTFIGDPARVDYQALPGEEFTERHSCLTAYVRASELARRDVDDLYDTPWWHGSQGLPPLAAGVENPYEPFHLDNFNYPPTFLLLTAPLAPLDGDFLAQRALWFGLNGLLTALGLWTVATWIGGPASHRTLLLAPLLFGSVPTLMTLQVGNFHLAATVLSVLAMVAFGSGRAMTGGALLATAILSKISPGLLGVVLLAQRRTRESLLAAGFGVVLLVASLLVFGTKPIRAFVSTSLPNLSSGAAFPFMDTAAGIATNMAPFGFTFKLELLGLEIGDPWAVGAGIARVYTVGLLLIAVVGARRRGDRRDQAIRWMSLLVLGAMQSPFSPVYSTLALLWATTLLAVEVRRTRDAVALIVLWPAMLYAGQGLSAVAQASLSMVQTLLILGVSAWLVLRPRVR